jgi:hypothetical protein
MCMHFLFLQIYFSNSLSYILHNVYALLFVHLSFKSPNYIYILHFVFVHNVYTCCFCNFCLCRSIFLNFLNCILHYVYACVWCTLCLFNLFYILHNLCNFYFELCVIYVWRSVIRDLRFFTFSPKTSCIGGETCQTNIIKLQLFSFNLNPLNLNLCQFLLPILLMGWG